MKLSEAQIKALKCVEMRNQYDFRFHTAESLVRRGLLLRFTDHVEKRTCADENGERVMASGPIQWHEWMITDAGRKALEQHHEAQ